MPLSRRLLLSLTPVLTLPSLPSAMSAPVTSRQDLQDPLISLTAFVDVLVPRDDLPSASDLDVDRRIIAKAATIPAYARLLRHGCRWLDSEAHTLDGSVSYFRDLEPDTQVRIVELAEAGKDKSVGRVFFRNVRQDTLRYYYAHPVVWRALGYDGPPQPIGFPEFDQPHRT